MLQPKYALRALLLCALAACTGDMTAPTVEDETLSALSDGANSGGVPGFYFLPPMVPTPSYSGTFDAALQPRVEICQLAGALCGPAVASYPFGSGSGSVRVDAAAQHYIANWNTPKSLDPALFYRVQVFVGTFRLGYADVDVVRTGKEKDAVDRTRFVPLIAGQTLPVKFRIETGIAGQVVVSPATASMAVGGTQQFTATMADLHGNPIPGAPAAWATSAAAVATVDATGLATGVATGQATITATSGAASGSATLTVFNPNTPPVAAPDTFAAVGNVTVPVAAPGLLANDSDGEGDGLAVVPGTFATSGGGTVSVNADGSFTYLSAPGFTGTDRFSYTVTDGQGSTSASASLVSGYRVWYVDGAGAGPGDGRDSSPFTSLAGAEGASAGGETIFLRTGAGVYGGGITLKTGQSLTGQGIASDVTATLNGKTLVLLAAGTAPTVARASGTTVQVAANNVVQGMAVTAAAGAGIAGSGFGSLTVGSISVAAQGGPALDLSMGSVSGAFTTLSSAGSTGPGLRLVGVDGSFSAGAGTITSPAGPGVEVVGGAALFTYGGDIAVAGPFPVSVSGRTGGALAFSGTIASTGRGIEVQGNSGGLIAFNGPAKSLSTGGEPGVRLLNNAGAEISFGGGGLVIGTTTGTGFLASGGGTVQVTGASNVITASSGTAISVANTTIGAAGLSFRSVWATGGANGIILVNTGALNGLQVTGSGGPCSRADASCSGGTLTGIVGADGATAGNAVFLRDVRNVSLSSMRLTGAQNFAIRGVRVAGFTAENLLVDGSFGTSAAADEGAVSFDDLSQSALIRSSYIGGGIRNNLRVLNGAGVTLDRLVLDRDTIGLNHGEGGEDGVVLAGEGGTFAVTVQDSRFLGSRGHQVEFSVRGSAVADLVFSRNVLSNAHPFTVSGAGGVVVEIGQAPGDNVQLNYAISGNSMTGSRGSAVYVGKGLGSAAVNGSITGNAIGNPLVANSGSTDGNGITVTHASRGKHRVRIQGNRVHQYNGAAGIWVLAGGLPGSADPGVPHDGSVHATITGNTVAGPGTNNSGAIIDGLRLEAGSSSGDQYTMCVNVGTGGANDLASGGRAAEGGTPFTVVANAPGASPRLKMQGYPTVTDVGAAAHANIETTLQGANITGGNPGYVETTDATTTYAGNGAVGAPCDLP
jgi:hypothetical protein